MVIKKEIIEALCITNVTQLESLTDDYYPNGQVFLLFLNPKSGSEVTVGSVTTVECTLPGSNGAYVEVPVVVGKWNEIVFRSIKASAIDLTDLDAYVSIIKDVTL